MRKTRSSLIICLVLLFVLSLPLFAANQVNTINIQAVHTTIAPPVDAIEEIKKYKTLMEEGIISQQEFDAKKKQLLGI